MYFVATFACLVMHATASSFATRAHILVCRACSISCVMDEKQGIDWTWPKVPDLSLWMLLGAVLCVLFWRKHFTKPPNCDTSLINTRSVHSKLLASQIYVQHIVTTSNLEMPATQWLDQISLVVGYCYLVCRTLYLNWWLDQHDSDKRVFRLALEFLILFYAIFYSTHKTYILSNLFRDGRQKVAIISLILLLDSGELSKALKIIIFIFNTDEWSGAIIHLVAVFLYGAYQLTKTLATCSDPIHLWVISVPPLVLFFALNSACKRHYEEMQNIFSKYFGTSVKRKDNCVVLTHKQKTLMKNVLNRNQVAANEVTDKLYFNALFYSNVSGLCEICFLVELTLFMI